MTHEQPHRQLTEAEQAEIDAFMAGPELRQWSRGIEEKRNLARNGFTRLVEVEGVVQSVDDVHAAREAGQSVQGTRPHTSR